MVQEAADLIGGKITDFRVDVLRQEVVKISTEGSFPGVKAKNKAVVAINHQVEN